MLADDVVQDAVLRPSLPVALAASVVVHGVLIGIFAGDVSRPTADLSAAEPDRVRLSVILLESRTVTESGAIKASQSVPSGVTRPAVVRRPVPGNKAGAERQMSRARPAPRAPQASTATPIIGAPPAAADRSVALSGPAASDSMQERSADRGGVSIMPIYAPPPRYPLLARRMGLEGRVLMGVMVAADGTPVEVGIIAGSGHPVLDRAAVDAVRDWRFQVKGMVARSAAEAVEVPIRFALEEP